MESRDKLRHIERDPRPSPGLRAPLFDRLTGSGGSFGMPPEPFRTLDPNAVIESVRRDLERLLNTRTRPGWSAGSGKTGAAINSAINTAINYGLPDFAHINPSDIQACEALAASVAKIVEAFEPRISQVRVTLKPVDTDPRLLAGLIEGRILIDLVPEPVSFPLELRAGSGAQVESLKVMVRSA